MFLILSYLNYSLYKYLLMCFLSNKVYFKQLGCKDVLFETRVCFVWHRKRDNSCRSFAKGKTKFLLAQKFGLRWLSQQTHLILIKNCYIFTLIQQNTIKLLPSIYKYFSLLSTACKSSSFSLFNLPSKISLKRLSKIGLYLDCFTLGYLFFISSPVIFKSLTETTIL